MSHPTIIKVTANPLLRHKVHSMDFKPNGGVRPLCGGGRGGRSVLAWNQHFGGLAAINCKRCRKMMVRILTK